MKRFNKNGFDELSDIFCAWLGGVPEEREEVKDFLRSSGLSCLLSEHDLAEVFKGNVYFSEETFLAVYALIPVKLKAGGKELVLFPQVFNRLNLKAAEKPSARAANIGFAEAAAVLEAFYPEKKRYLDANRETLQKDNRKARNKTYSPEKYKLYRASLSEEKKPNCVKKADCACSACVPKILKKRRPTPENTGGRCLRKRKIISGLSAAAATGNIVRKTAKPFAAAIMNGDAVSRKKIPNC